MATQIELFPRRWLDYEPPSTCHDFGISELLAFALPALFEGAAGPTIGAEILGSALPGAALGAGTSALTGGKPLVGALTGGLTGGAIGGAGSIAGDLGVSPAIAQTLAGGTVGALGSELTGQNPLIGGLGGAGAGLLSSAFSGSAPGSTGGGPSSGTPAAGPALASGTPTSAAPLSSDLTAGASIGGDFGGGGTGIGGGSGIGNLLGSTSLPAAGGATPLTGDLGSATGNIASGGGANSGGGIAALESSPLGGVAKAAAPAEGNWLSDALGTTGGTGVGSRFVNYIGNNPAVPLGAGLLAGTYFMGNKTGPAENSLKENSATLTRLGNQETQSLQTGQVPPGAQSLLNRQKSAMDAHTRSSYAALGLGGSTMEAQALNQNAQTVEANKWTIISDLVKSGTSALSSASNIDERLMLQEIARDQALQRALASFAGSLAGSAATSSGSSQKQAA